MGYWVLAFLRSTQGMKNQMFVYLASCFYLILLELQCFSEEIRWNYLEQGKR
ncbi:MAG: hypothetical protein AB1765_08835 [Candidatus Hydrogenedentota bacterium]